MRILVVGAGKVGYVLAEQLTNEEHDVVVIDQDEAVIQHIEDTLDVLCVKGNGASAKTLMNAGADKADIIITATHSDEVNMLCSLMAKRLGTKYAIARIRDPEYHESINVLQQELDIDMPVNPERGTAQEISRLLRFPFADGIESFAKGRVEMVEFRAREEDAVVNVPLREINERLPGIPQVLYAAVERDGQVYIPNGDFVIRDNDKVHVVGDMLTITSYFRYLGKNNMRIRNVLIMGGGRIAFYLSKLIIPLGFHVSIIEINEKHAQFLSEILPEANIICGDATDQDLLEQEGLSRMDAFVALSNRDEENLMTGLFASRQGVKKVVVKNNRVSYLDLVSDMGLDSIISPKSITSSNILRYVRARVNGGGTKVEKLYRLMNGKAEALEFAARLNDPYIGVPLRALKIRKDTLVAIIVRRGKVFVPFGNDHIEAGDRVVIIAHEAGITDLNEVIRT